jgi:hypothetical protein
MESDSYNPKKTLWALLSDDAKRLFNNAKDAVTAAEKRLSEREWKGDDTSYARAALYELDYWVSCTVDVDAVMAALARLQTALDCPDPPSRIFPTGTGDIVEDHLGMALRRLVMDKERQYTLDDDTRMGQGHRDHRLPPAAGPGCRAAFRCHELPFRGLQMKDRLRLRWHLNRALP